MNHASILRGADTPSHWNQNIRLIEHPRTVSPTPRPVPPRNRRFRGADYGAEMLEKGAQIGAVQFALRRRNLHQFAPNDPHRPTRENAGNSAENAAFCAKTPGITREDERGAARIRTGASRICNPLPSCELPLDIATSFTASCTHLDVMLTFTGPASPRISARVRPAV
jgi:hypothetical protein